MNTIILVITLFCQKPIDADYDYSGFTKFKVDDRVKLTKYKNIFSKGYTENWSKEIFVIDFLLKSNPWIDKWGFERFKWGNNSRKLLCKRIVVA